jgi:hypothetical protein
MQKVFGQVIFLRMDEYIFIKGFWKAGGAQPRRIKREEEDEASD